MAMVMVMDSMAIPKATTTEAMGTGIVVTTVTDQRLDPLGGDKMAGRTKFQPGRQSPFVSGRNPSPIFFLII